MSHVEELLAEWKYEAEYHTSPDRPFIMLDRAAQTLEDAVIADRGEP